VINLINHSKIIATLVLALAAIVVCPNLSLAQSNSLDRFSGIWLVNEEGSFLNALTAKGNIIWEIRQIPSGLEIIVPNRNITFRNVMVEDSRVRASEKIQQSGENQSFSEFSLDILFSKYAFRGKFGAPDGNYEISGELPNSLRQSRRETTRLRKAESLAKDQMAQLSQQIENLESKNRALNEGIDKYKEDLLDAQRNLSNRERSLLNKLDKALDADKKAKKLVKLQKVQFEKKIASIKNSASAIDVSHLPFSYRLRFNSELKAEPKDQARSFLKLKAGDPVIFLFEIPGSEWALISTSQGKLGYIPAAFLKEVQRILPQQPLAATPQISQSKEKKAPENSPPAPKPISTAIVISEPRWDSGQKNMRMTVAAAGFMTLSGAVKAGQPVQSLKINQTPVDVSRDGKFQKLLNITSSQRMEILAILLDGRSEKLTFDLVVSP
jgi:hypothetical protein